MRGGIIRLFFVLLLGNYWLSGFSQNDSRAGLSERDFIDSLKMMGTILDVNKEKPEIELSRSQALDFLRRRLRPQLWKNTRDPFRLALDQLIYEASHPVYDSAEYLLKRYPFNSLVLADTTITVAADSLREVTSSYSKFPFRYYTQPYQADSIKVAVNLLLDFLEVRDSSVINFTDINDVMTPVWLNSKYDRAIRYWLKNDLNDSVTVWISNPSRNTIGLYLEKGVGFRRPVMQGYYSEAKVNVQYPDKTKLIEAQKITVKPLYWKYRTEVSFILNQAMLTNWVKGGESYFSTTLDITGYVDYNNKPLKLSSNHFARLKYGYIASGDKGIRKNLDLLETNSKLNHKAFGKFDFSSIMLFKTQISKGYNYPNDSVPVSKFINPAILTIGFGLDYKPNKATSINFSPFSYKGTFVPDTARIDQTKYGVPADRRSKNEPGASFMITNEYKPVKNITVTNRLQLFTNYINNPQNVDIDWELILVANLNWFTDVRLNTHLIFDDDTRTPVFDKDKNPVLGSDGIQKKTA
ncbi:MAG TPA: DUF3078 domain-containing protein, partial [Bacteroidales bacterium]|nr:DUF3078 domain-containing protein [Bacteroidales bacterium]